MELICGFDPNNVIREVAVTADGNLKTVEQTPFSAVAHDFDTDAPVAQNGAQILVGVLNTSGIKTFTPTVFAKAAAAAGDNSVVVDFTFQYSADSVIWAPILNAAGTAYTITITAPGTTYVGAVGVPLTVPSTGYVRCTATETHNNTSATVDAKASYIEGQ